MNYNIIKKHSNILGLDLGLSNLGYAIVSKNNYFLSHINHGCILTSKYDMIHFRIEKIYSILKDIIEFYSPEIICIEKVFHNQNSSTINVVNQVHGAIYLLIAKLDKEDNKKIRIIELTPIQVKNGIGLLKTAKKREVMESISKYFSIKKPKVKFDDSFDALALCLAFFKLNKLINALRMDKPF